MNESMIFNKRARLLNKGKVIYLKVEVIYKGAVQEEGCANLLKVGGEALFVSYVPYCV